MRRFLPILACLLVAALPGAALAQQQEKGLSERLNAAPDMALVNPMQNQAYGSGQYSTKTFGSASYGGVKNANVKTFSTRSFFGLKNPWFGRKVLDTNASSLANHSAADSREKFSTATFGTKPFDRSAKPDLQDTTDSTLPSAAQPRPFLVAGKTQESLERYTQNLKKDLTIDDVRDLLNKGTSK